MSALTIPDMWKIVERHGLVPVPVDLDPATLAPRPGSWLAASSERTRAVVVAHLFGAKVALEPIAKLAREKGWILLEDCAQSFTGSADRGPSVADVSMFSFGPIKTATALSGGVLVVRDRPILDKMRARQATLPLQTRGSYAKRIAKYAGLAALSKRTCYALFVRLCRLLGKDHDLVIQGSVRGFAGGDFFAKIRHRPSAALLSLLARRLESDDSWRIDGRVARARRLAAALPEALTIPAAAAPAHSFWVFTVLADDPDRVVAELRASGFDATRAASLRCVPAPPAAAGRAPVEPREAQRILARTVYLPVYPEMPERAIDAMAAALARALRATPKDVAEPVLLTPAPASPGIAPRPRR
jgi:dTDP-4-amino-4,6-dideoxygalactose transaminase